MKRKDGYYWVRIHGTATWVCALYREILVGKGCWFMPGMREPLFDYSFDFISAEPIPSPNQPNTAIWMPGT